ncbi:MAG: hypothetical protein PHU45_04955 [Bacilli bacterium]|nr:hypothetical protein [Bacilli bacterium]
MEKFNLYYDNLNPEIKAYFEILSPIFPRFLIPFIETDTMMRLKDIGYFCGMDYADKEVYGFKYYLSALDHSISTALMVWGKTFDDKMTLAALFHDAGNPALRHVIDYLNNDHVNQESTEIDLNIYLAKDKHLMSLFNIFGYNIEDISNYKKYPLVDSKRPKLCADRLDGIFLSSLVWAKSIILEEIENIYENIIIKKNENNEDEFSFIDLAVADYVVEQNVIINSLTQTNDDYILMSILARIIKILIDTKIIKYDDLFILTDRNIFEIIEKSLDVSEIYPLYREFKDLSHKLLFMRKPIKKRIIDPLVLEFRYSDY